MLLIIVAYILVGATLSTAEIVVTAQKDLTILSEARLRTDLTIDPNDISISGNGLNFSVTNTGNEKIADFAHLDIYTFDGTSDYQRQIYDKDTTHAAGTWALMRIDNDYTNPSQIDPGERAWIMAVFTGSNPVFVQMTTHNGVTAQLTAPVEGW